MTVTLVLQITDLERLSNKEKKIHLACLIWNCLLVKIPCTLDRRLLGTLDLVISTSVLFDLKKTIKQMQIFHFKSCFSRSKII